MCPTGCEDWFEYEERTAQQERYERQRDLDARFREYQPEPTFDFPQSPPLQLGTTTMSGTVIETDAANQQLRDFDYGELPGHEQAACEKDAAKIIEHEKRGLALLVAQGGLLKRVQTRLANHKNGTFRKWVEAKVPFTYETAYKRISIHNAFADIVSQADNISIDTKAAEFIAGLVAKDAITDEQMSSIVDEAKTQPVSKSRAKALLEPADNSQPASGSESVNANRGNDWPAILSTFAKRKSVSYEELAEHAGMKNPEKIRRYASQWADASGLVVEKNEDGISVRSGGDAVESIFGTLPARTKRKVLQKLHLDEDMVQAKFKEFKRNNTTVQQHITEALYKVHDMLHGIVQEYRSKEHLLKRMGSEQARDLLRVQSLIESLSGEVEAILHKGVGNVISDKQ
jgi:hypothetical protein